MRPHLAACGLLAVLAGCSGAGTPAAAPSPVLTPSEAAASPSAAPPVVSPAPTARATTRPPTAAASSAAPQRTRAASRRTTEAAAPSPSLSPSAARRAVTADVAEVTGDRFSPSALTVHVGDSVLVTDKDAAAPHTFTISALGVDSGTMSQGDTFRYTFRRAGRFTFVCSIHQGFGMTGTVTVLS